QRDDQSAVVQPPTPEGVRGRTQRDHLRVPGRVTVAFSHIDTLTDHGAALIEDDRPNRYVTGRLRGRSNVERAAHRLLVGHSMSCSNWFPNPIRRAMSVSISSG